MIVTTMGCRNIISNNLINNHKFNRLTKNHHLAHLNRGIINNSTHSHCNSSKSMIRKKKLNLSKTQSTKLIKSWTSRTNSTINKSIRWYNKSPTKRGKLSNKMKSFAM